VPDVGGPDSCATREILLLRLKADAPAREVAWREFHDLYAPIIGSFARKMGARPQDVDDLVQEVLTGFFAVSPRFVYDPARGRFRGYLKTCTWNAFRKRLGAQVLVGGRPLEDVDPADLQVEAAWNDVWESEKLQRALAVVRERYTSRPDRVRTFRAFEMYTMLERPAEEVAADLGMSVESVHQSRTRITRALRAMLDEIDATTG
jgi:RNA polymerase sigma-70 factor, ECF subfamily